jgi:uncharacterized membrane protein YphA (DoxX/SURF4 family)
MKAIINISRIIVGVLFIFSGLVKANDPLGLSYKMQEFFEVWGWHALNDYTLAFSVLMIAFEIIAGVAVLLGWRMNLFSWLLLLLIVFFTFLTAYALFSGKIKECGCFGDCIPLQAQQSFIKDLILLVLILLIFPFRNKIQPALTARSSIVVLLATTVFSFGLQWYVLKHLPIVDCLPYKVGNNIPQKMEPEPGSIKDSTVIMFTYEKNGKQQSFTADEFPADFDDSYTFVKREDKVVRKGTAVAAIRDFALQNEHGNDTTMVLLHEPGLKLYLFIKDGYKRGGWEQEFAQIVEKAKAKNIKTFIVTNLEHLDIFDEELTILRADGTAIKTAARHNPTLFLIDRGTVLNKWSAPDLDKAFNKVNGL